MRAEKQLKSTKNEKCFKRKTLTTLDGFDIIIFADEKVGKSMKKDLKKSKKVLDKENDK